MSIIPNYAQNVSLRMSQVMDEIGVNEKIVMKRRRSWLLNESIYTLTHHLMEEDINVYMFGSQSEGTTTLFLNSDTDMLCTFKKFNVIQDWSEWEYGKYNLLMTQDKNVSPGYCLLQLLRDDVPLPVKICGIGSIFFKNTFFGRAYGHVRNGPAQTRHNKPGFFDTDVVPSYTCKSFPAQARQWFEQQREVHWPSDDMKQYCYNTQCFVVSVGNKGSANEDFEWRISTSLAERCLMFNLNITQIRCYVLMKMILKTFITPHFPESISSFMCKTILLHCVSNTRAEEWKDISLLLWLQFCLSTLYNCVVNEYCPHFIITENNLMLRRVSSETKPLILQALRYVIESYGRSLLEIEFDNFGVSLQSHLSGTAGGYTSPEPFLVARQVVMSTALCINHKHNYLLYKVNSLSVRQALQQLSIILSRLCNKRHTYVDRRAFCLMTRHLCHTIGSIRASLDIYNGCILAYDTLYLMSLGLNSDALSGKLKLASIFYCIGEFQKTALILKTIEECYDISTVETTCHCYEYERAATGKRFDILCYESNQEHQLLKHITASCVRFLRCEVNCCPKELQREMFRSTQEDLSYRQGYRDTWMDMAVVDSLPFLYYLQYKTYCRLGANIKKQQALSNLVRTIEQEKNLGHRDTALNLVGQCFENISRKDSALKCYLLSLKLRSRNNLANFLIRRLLISAFNHGDI